jgi:hypothetical protein
MNADLKRMLLQPIDVVQAVSLIGCEILVLFYLEHAAVGFTDQLLGVRAVFRT